MIKQDESFEKAAQILRDGGLVAFPTETVYGLGGDALNPESSKKIYAAKNRPSDNPLIVHICDISALNKLCVDVPEYAYKLAQAFWPGPLTMILKKSPIVPYETTGGLNTVAVRMPDHEGALKLLRESGVYIAAPSANLSGKPSPTTAGHVLHDMNGRIDAIIDGGEVGIGIESTIVDLTKVPFAILRPGYISPAMLEDVLKEVIYDPAILDENASKDLRPRAPGMKYRHYAPKAGLTIIKGAKQSVVDKINSLVENNTLSGLKTGIIATEETAAGYKGGNIKIAGSIKDPVTISHSLYAILRSFDDEGVDVIYSESFDNDEFGRAIMNRLTKAAGHKIIEADGDRTDKE